MKELLTSARNEYIVWLNAVMTRSGTLCSDMRRSSLKFMFALRWCNQNEESIRADQ